MSKSKKVIKSIVKECLIEILAEGLIGNKSATLSEVREFKGAVYESNERMLSERSIYEQPIVSKSRHVEPRRKSYLDSITMGVDNANKTKNTNSSQLREKVNKITADPVMADIFADTAMTTLKEQKEGVQHQASVSSQGDAAAKMVDQSLPEDLFGGASSKWANLAFAPSIRKS